MSAMSGIHLKVVLYDDVVLNLGPTKSFDEGLSV